MTAVSLRPVMDIVIEPVPPGEVKVGDHIALAKQLKACLDGDIPFHGVVVTRINFIEEEGGAFQFWGEDTSGPNFVDWNDEDEFDEEGEIIGDRTGHTKHSVPYASVAPILRFQTPEGAGQA